MKVLVTGAAGMLGRAIVLRGMADCEVIGISRGDADLAVPAAVENIVVQHQPDWIVHCAAWTNVDGAESNQKDAMVGNATITKNLVNACEKQKSGLTMISTDYVFDGSTDSGYVEGETRDPVNYYGRTKACGEEFVEQMKAPWQIVRTSWLFGDGNTNFVKTMRRLLGERETLRVVEDQKGSPTYVDDLAAVVEFLVCARKQGIFHGTNSGVTTWCGLAQEVARCLGTEADRIVGCPSSEYPTPAKRPANSVLLSRRLEDAGCPERPAWQDAVARYVSRLEAGDVLCP
ncbi:MAG: dTDP-4-dehydrorhamnose reductase [Candidatus Krumholzibacteriia bacterium]